MTKPAFHLPFFITDPDKDLIRATASRDPLGIIPVRSVRGRDLVPHLTEQTDRAAGFQLLLSIYGLRLARVICPCRSAMFDRQ